MSLMARILFFLGVVGYIFYPRRSFASQRTISRMECLQEHRDMLLENLHDLNFEYHAGKYSEEDFVVQRKELEDEMAQVVIQITELEEMKGV